MQKEEIRKSPGGFELSTSIYETIVQTTAPSFLPQPPCIHTACVHVTLFNTITFKIVHFIYLFLMGKVNQYWRSM